jgi:hypothetical protein
LQRMMEPETASLHGTMPAEALLRALEMVTVSFRPLPTDIHQNLGDEG